MVNNDNVEAHLRAIAKQDVPEQPKAPILKRALQKAKHQTACKEGLGFLAALLWVLVAGVGARLYQLVEHSRHTMTNSPSPIKKTPSPKNEGVSR